MHGCLNEYSRTINLLRRWHARVFTLACDLNLRSIRATQPTHPIFFATRGIPYSKKNIRVFTVDTTSKQRDESIPRLCFTRSIPVGLVLIRMGCIVYLPSPRTPRTQQATPPSVVCKLIIAQLKLSHPAARVTRAPQGLAWPIFTRSGFLSTFLSCLAFSPSTVSGTRSSTTLGWYVTRTVVRPETSKRVKKRASDFWMGVRSFRCGVVML